MDHTCSIIEIKSLTVSQKSGGRKLVIARILYINIDCGL